MGMLYLTQAQFQLYLILDLLTIILTQQRKNISTLLVDQTLAMYGIPQAIGLQILKSMVGEETRLSFG